MSLCVRLLMVLSTKDSWDSLMLKILMQPVSQDTLKGKFKVFFTYFFYWLIASYLSCTSCVFNFIDQKNYSARYELLKNAFFASCHTISCRGRNFT